MDLRPLKRLGTLACTAAIALALISCNGSNGPAGTNGTNGTPGAPGAPGSGPVVNVANLTPAEWGALSLTGSVTSVDLSKGTPVVQFSVASTTGLPVVGLGITTKSATATLPGYSNLAFTIAKLVPGTGKNAQWVNYIVNTVPTLAADGVTVVAPAPTKPTTDNTGTLVDNGNGNYTYTFYRDITKTEAFLDAATYSGNNLRADLGDVTYAPALTHRIAIQVGGNAPGTGTNTPTGIAGATAVPILNPANITYDFIPATGKPVAPTDTDRVMTNVAACNACHTRLEVHGGNRIDPLYCTVCHTDQRKYGNANTTVNGTALVPPTGTTSTNKINGLAAGNFPAFIHRLHMGEALNLTGYNYGGILFNTVRYPQDIRNCQTCHTNQPQSAVKDAPPVAPQTAQGDNWMNAPSRLACGACHDNVDFTQVHGSNVPPQGDDSLCALCHLPADIAIYHTPVWTPVQAGSNLVPAHGGMQSFSYQATNTANLPKGAHTLSWNLISAKVTAGIPSLTFSILMDGSPITLNAQPGTVPAATTAVDMFPASAPFVNNLFGAAYNSPEFFMIAGLPQDGITPADFNYRLTPTLKSIWSGATATATLPITWKDNGNSTYTITCTGYKLPAGTGVVAMGIGLGLLTETDLTKPDPNLISSFTLATNSPLFTAMDFTYNANNYTALPTGGLLIPSRVQMMNVTGTLGSIPALTRRTIIKTNACNTCHGTLGAFTAVTGSNNFHSVGIGDGNDGASCVICHNTTGVDGTAFSYNTKPWIHALHAGGMRDNPYTPEAAAAQFWAIGYPGLLNNCEVCHVPGSYDFSNTANAAQVPYMLWDTVAKGTPAISPAVSYPVTKNGVTYSVPQSVSQAAAAGVPWTPPAAPPTSGATFGYYSPFVSMTASYGNNSAWTAPLSSGGPFVYNPAAVAQLTATNTTAPVTNLTGSLVVSPITSACSACHDTAQAISHFKANGGVWYVDRYTAGGSTLGTPVASGANYAWPTGNLVNNEQCLICHGSGTVADIKAVHMNF